MSPGPSADPGAPPSLAVVIVTFDSEEQIPACLSSVDGGSGGRPVEVVVVDNASRDHTTDVVKRGFPAVRLVANRRNRGFGAACNQGIETTSADLVLLLNPDAHLQPDTLPALVDYLAEHPEAGIVGPALETPAGDLQRDISATGTFPSFVQALFEYTRLGRWFPDSRWVTDYFLPGFDRRSNRRVAMVQGACLLARRSVLRDLGGFDEGFFLYFEETDLCKRALEAGWETHYVGTAAATHLGARSSPDGRPLARHFIRSMYRFHRKHYGALEAVALWAILAPYHVGKTARMWLAARRNRDDAQLRADLLTVAQRCTAHFRLAGDRR